MENKTYAYRKPSGRRETATCTTAHHLKICSYVLLSNLNDSLLKYSFVFSQNPITLCQTFLLLSPITHRSHYEQKSAKYSSKTNLIHAQKQPYWKKINFQLRKNNFPVGKQNFSNWAFPAFQLDLYENTVL